MRPALTIPAALQSAIDAVTVLFTSLLTLVSGIIFPTTLTPISVLAAAGFLLPLIFVVVRFTKGLASGGGN